MKRILFTSIIIVFTLLSNAQDLEMFLGVNFKYGYRNKYGSVLIPPEFDIAYAFSDGLAAVKQSGKYGFIDKTGKFVIQPSFDNAYPFVEGLARVKQNGKWGFINKSGVFVIQPSFDEAKFFKKGLAEVKQNGKYGFIDKSGNFYLSEKEARGESIETKNSKPDLYNKTFEQYLADYGKGTDNRILSETEMVAAVEAEVMAWQEKGEFEPTAEWKKRVNEETRTLKINELVKRLTDKNNRIIATAAKDYCEYRAKKFTEQPFELKPYDADNECYLISTANYGDILLPVPLAKAPAFKQNWNSIKSTASANFVINGNDVALQSVKFGEYVYDANTNANYTQVDIDYNFRPIDIKSINSRLGDLASESPSQKKQAIVRPRHIEPERKNLEAGISISDVDKNIPASGLKASRTFALVIANSNYRHASKVENAENDGRIFSSYLSQTLGLPADNITTLHDATLGDIASGVSHLQDIAKAYRREPFSVMVYYVGHGLPDEENRESYILPVDASPRNTRVCYPLKDLYAELGALGAESVTVIIDACFSGSNHGDGMLLAQSMGVAIKAKETDPQGNMVVFAAAQGDETAFPYSEQNHGLFTYWLLKKLQQTKGNVTLGELADYVTDNVSKTSVLKNRKPQTPSVAISPALKSAWRQMPLVR